MTTSTRSVLLAGASGVFGRHISAVLRDAGYTVLGIGRGEGNAVRADLNDRDQLLAAVDGSHADIVVHAATALKRPPTRHRDMTATDRLRTIGMRNLIEAARAAGASRLISESMVFGYGYGRHGAVLAETAPFGPPQRDAHLDEHVSAMRIKEELAATTPGIDGVSLRFGLFYGPGGATESLLPALRRRMLPAPSSGGNVLPWIHVEDAAAAVLAAIEHGRPGSAYNIVDDLPLSFGDHIRATADAFGAPKPLTLPAWSMLPLPLLSAMLGTDLRLTSTKARVELGWAPRYPRVADGLAAMADGVPASDRAPAPEAGTGRAGAEPTRVERARR